MEAHNVDFDSFTGQVQHRLELADTGEALRAIRATLTTLGERIQAGEASDLASSLPMEIDRYLHDAESGQRFGYDEFVERVWSREEMSDPNDRADAAYHAQVVLAVVAETVPATEMEQVRGQLPAEFDSLFELVDSDAQ